MKASRSPGSTSALPVRQDPGRTTMPAAHIEVACALGACWGKNGRLGRDFIHPSCRRFCPSDSLR